MKKKIKIVSWIIEAELNDGRVVKLDTDKQSSSEVDSFINDIEEKCEVEDWILKVKCPRCNEDMNMSDEDDKAEAKRNKAKAVPYCPKCKNNISWGLP